MPRRAGQRRHEGITLHPNVFADAKGRPTHWRYMADGYCWTFPSLAEATEAARFADDGRFTFVRFRRSKMSPLDRLNSMFLVLPDEGRIVHRVSGPESWRVAGEDAGGVAGPEGNRYHRVNVGSLTKKRAHWLWAYVHGQFPPQGMVLDHINRDTLDDRIQNLRLCTPSENNLNRPSSGQNSTGRHGVMWNARDRSYIAQIKREGVTYERRQFKRFEDAVAHREMLEVKYGGGFCPTPTTQEGGK